MSGNCRWELHSSIPQNSSPSACNGPGMGQHGNHGRDCPPWTSFIAAAADSRSPSFHKEYEFLLELTTLAPWPTHFSVLLSKVSGTKPVGFVMVLSQTLCRCSWLLGPRRRRNPTACPGPRIQGQSRQRPSTQRPSQWKRNSSPPSL